LRPGPKRLGKNLLFSSKGEIVEEAGNILLGALIGGLISLLLSVIFSEPLMILRNHVIYLFKYVIFGKKDQGDIIGIYYGYYLKNDDSTDVIFKESLWEIYSSIIKNKYHIKTYKVSDKERDEIFETLRKVRNYNKGEQNQPTTEEKAKIKKLKLSYKGEMCCEGDHYLFTLESQKEGADETIFERRFLPRGEENNQEEDNQLIGISLAINKNGFIRANISILSKTKLESKEDFYRIVDEFGGGTDDTIYNMSLNV
jgi:hypothetical protein